MLKERIEMRPRVCNGKPVIKGTRIPVTVILEQLADGQSWDALLKVYPEIMEEDIKAALLYAKSSIDHTALVSSTAFS